MDVWSRSGALPEHTVHTVKEACLLLVLFVRVLWVSVVVLGCGVCVCVYVCESVRACVCVFVYLFMKMCAWEHLLQCVYVCGFGLFTRLWKLQIL